MIRSFRNFFIIILSLSLILSGCGKEKPKEPLSIGDLETIHETEFGGVYLKISIEDFNKLGFKYGDSVDLEFSNGYKLEDIPYYNGYYVDAGCALLIAYPGYDYLKAAINYGEDLWERAKLKTGNLQSQETLWQQAALEEHSTAKINLNTAGKYLDVQEARDIHYSDEREKFDSDVIFANFRNIVMGNISEGVLFRSASPCDNQHKRAPYVDALICQQEVQCILNLSDNDTKIEGYLSKEDFNSPYFRDLYEAGGIIPIALNMNYLSDEFAQKIARGFIEMSQHEGPYLVHCTEGKDRTGFVCMLLEALAGAKYQEIADDYMLTYDNYYKITAEKEPAKYNTILEKNLDAMLSFVVGDDNVDIKTADLVPYAKDYLLKAGMSDAQIDALLTALAN